MCCIMWRALFEAKPVVCPCQSEDEAGDRVLRKGRAQKCAGKSMEMGVCVVSCNVFI